MEQRIIFTDNPSDALGRLLDEMHGGAPAFLLVDTNTARLCAPLLEPALKRADGVRVIEIPAGDDHKTLDTVAAVWQRLSAEGATRRSLLINLGGGMVTDLGGFAAATFKRGIRFINIPTTLLGAVDAAVGGKTGINFGGLKNEIGAFRQADAVIISAAFYATLPDEQLLSGYGEVLKHSLIDSTEALGRALDIDIAAGDLAELAAMVQESVMVKRRIVAADPLEQGLRKSLNLGHTVAHASESLAMERQRPVAHGIAVAHGLVTDLVLSNILLKFPSSLLQQVAAYVREHYPAPQIDCTDYDRMIALMRHDKKNASASEINFTLLSAPGEVKIDCTATPEQIKTALDIMRDLLGV